MKKIIIVLCCFITIGIKAQTVQELINNSSENLPEQSITDKFPKLFKIIKQMQKEESKLKNVYYGNFNSNMIIRKTVFNGSIFIDKDFLNTVTSKLENMATWNFLSSVGILNYTYGLENPDRSEYTKSMYFYALNKAKAFYDTDKDWGILQFGVNDIRNKATHNNDEITKSAAGEVYNSDTYKEMASLIERLKTNNQPETKSSPNNSSNKVEDNKTKVVEKNKVRNNGIFMQKEKENIDMIKVNKLLEDFNVTTDFASKASMYKYKSIGESFSSSSIYLTIHKIDKSYFLQMHIIYVESGASFINTYTLVADNTTYPLNKINENSIRGNGTNHSGFVASLKDEEQIKYFELFASAKKSEVYYNGVLNTASISLSKREKKYILKTLELYRELTQ